MPLTYDSRLIARLLQQLRKSLLRGIKHTGRVIKETILRRVLARQHTGSAGATQRVGYKTIRKTYSIACYTVQVGSRNITLIIATHHLRRMVVSHNIDNIIRALRLVFTATRRKSRHRSQPIQDVCLRLFHILIFIILSIYRAPRTKEANPQITLYCKVIINSEKAGSC